MHRDTPGSKSQSSVSQNMILSASNFVPQACGHGVHKPVQAQEATGQSILSLLQQTCPVPDHGFFALVLQCASVSDQYFHESRQAFLNWQALAMGENSQA